MKQKRLIIAVVLLLVLVLSVALTACNKKDTDPAEVVQPELITKEALTSKIITEMSGQGVLFNESANYFDESEVGFEEANRGKAILFEIIDNFAEELVAKGFAKEKADKLVAGLTQTIVGALLKEDVGSINPLNLVSDLMDVLADVGLTAEDTGKIISSIYSAFCNVFTSGSNLARAKGYADNYLAEIETKYKDNEEIKTYLKKNAIIKYVKNYLDNFYGFITETRLVASVKTPELSQAQYEKIKALLDGVIVAELDTYDNVVTAVTADSATEKTVLAYVNAKLAAEASLVAPTDAFKTEIDNYRAVYEKYDEFFDSAWAAVFVSSNYKASSKEAYDYINNFFNGFDAEDDDEDIVAYKTVAPTTAATIPADYTGLNEDWYKAFTLALEQDYYNVMKYSNVPSWYTYAYETVQYLAEYEYEADIVFSDSFNSAVLDVIQPLVETAFNLGASVSGLEKLVSGDLDKINSGDVSAIIDAINKSVDEVIAFCAANNAKLTTLTGELRAFAKVNNTGVTLYLADIIDTIVNAGPDVAKIIKLFTSSITPEVINGFGSAIDFAIKTEHDGGIYNSYIYSAKVFYAVFTNPAFDSADEVNAAIANIINKSSGYVQAELIELLSFYEQTFDISDLYDFYYASFGVDESDRQGWHDAWEDDYDVDESVHRYITASIKDEKGKITDDTFAAYQADVLSVINMLLPGAKRNMFKGFDEVVVKPLFEGSYTYVIGYDEVKGEFIEETKTSLELLAMLASAAPGKNIENSNGDPTVEFININSLRSYLGESCEMILDLVCDVAYIVLEKALEIVGEPEETYSVVAAQFAKDATVSQKTMVYSEEDVFFTFVYTGGCDTIRVNAVGSDALPSEICLFVHNDELYEYLYQSSDDDMIDECYLVLFNDPDDGVFIFENAADNLVEGFTYSVLLKSGIDYIPCVYSLEFYTAPEPVEAPV